MELRDQSLAENLKRLRRQRNLSLDAAAHLTGVSRSMLAQIERGESNPTVSTLSKITVGLRISFEELLCPKNDELRIVDPSITPKHAGREGRYSAAYIFPYEAGRHFEQMLITIEPGQVCGRLLPEEDMNEYVTVIGGMLHLRYGDEEYDLSQGMSARIPAGAEHVYCNHETEQLRLCLIFSKE